MKFSLERDTFAKVLKRIDGVCASRGSFQILSSCMIEARGKTITVTGTDLDIALRVIEDATVMEEGVIVINARRLLDTVQNQASGEVLLVSEGSQVLVQSGNFRARISCGDVTEYPKVPDIEIKSSLSIDAITFKKLIDKTYFSISKDDSRAEFTGAFLKISQEGNMQMVSTDGHRLSLAEATVSVGDALPESLETGVIIPRKALSELTKNILDGDVVLDVSNSKLVIMSGSSIFYITLIAGNFPDFSKVVPVQLDHRCVVRRDEFQQILKRASIFTSKAGLIRLTMSKGQLEVATQDVKAGEMSDFMVADYDGTGVTAGFNWRYIDEILSVIDGDSVSLEIIDMDSPAVVRDVDDRSFDFIIMPMQL